MLSSDTARRRIDSLWEAADQDPYHSTRLLIVQWSRPPYFRCPTCATSTSIMKMMKYGVLVGNNGRFGIEINLPG